MQPPHHQPGGVIRTQLNSTPTTQTYIGEGEAFVSATLKAIHSKKAASQWMLLPPRALMTGHTRVYGCTRALW